ncbi:MAG: hypothetical protein AAFX41_03090 [Bacteroidota bacterium]
MLPRFLLLLALCCAASVGPNALAQELDELVLFEPDDYVSLGPFMRATLRAEPNARGAEVGAIAQGDTVLVVGGTRHYYAILEDDGTMIYATAGAFRSADTQEIKAKLRVELRRRELASQREAREQRAAQLAEQRRQQEILNEERRNAGREFLVRALVTTSPNTADGVSAVVAFDYVGERTIKYARFWVQPFNAVGDPVQSGIGDRGLIELELTGPIREGLETVSWDNVWYNPTITCAKLERVQLEYMDGRDYMYINELPRVIASAFNNDCSYSSQELRALQQESARALRDARERSGRR